LLDHILWSFGVKPLAHHEIIEAWAEELKRTARLPRGQVEITMDQDPPGEDPGFDSEATEIQGIKWSR
jgi:hypothetical protein